MAGQPSRFEGYLCKGHSLRGDCQDARMIFVPVHCRLGALNVDGSIGQCVRESECGLISLTSCNVGK